MRHTLNWYHNLVLTCIYSANHVSIQTRCWLGTPMCTTRRRVCAIWARKTIGIFFSHEKAPGRDPYFSHRWGLLCKNYHPGIRSRDLTYAVAPAKQIHPTSLLVSGLESQWPIYRRPNKYTQHHYLWLTDTKSIQPFWLQWAGVPAIHFTPLFLLKNTCKL